MAAEDGPKDEREPIEISADAIAAAKAAMARLVKMGVIEAPEQKRD